MLAESLRAARIARGLSQEEAAKELEVHRTTLALWETGAARPRGPSKRYIEHWCEGAVA